MLAKLRRDGYKCEVSGESVEHDDSAAYLNSDGYKCGSETPYWDLLDEQHRPEDIVVSYSTELRVRDQWGTTRTEACAFCDKLHTFAVTLGHKVVMLLCEEHHGQLKRELDGQGR